MTEKESIFALKNLKKLAGVLAILAVCGLTAGCDDYEDDHHHPRPPHEDRHSDHHKDEHHDHNGHRPPPRDEHHHQRPVTGNHHHEPRRHASLAGSYYARALNDAVAPKGTTISLNVVQGDDESLHLVDPTGKKYPIRFDAKTGTGYIAGGSLSLREDGLFVYNDARGGIWLVERQ